jgi:predicted HTH transcriptional regulator
MTTLLLLRAGYEYVSYASLESIVEENNNLVHKIEKEKSTQETKLPLLSGQVLELLHEHERLTIAQIVDLSGANQNTLKVRLRELVNTGRIQRHGKARATWYCLP